MRIKEFFLLLLIAVTFVFTVGSSAQSATVIGISDITSPQGDLGGNFALENIINQSGLSAGFTSGVTDFDTYTTSTTHNSLGAANSGFTATAGLPQLFTFDIGAETSIDGFAFWEVDNPGSVTIFQLFADDNTDFDDGLGALLGTFFVNANGTGNIAQIGSFTSLVTRFVHLNAFAPGNLFDGIGEFAFRSGDVVVSAVPVPAALPLFGTGLALMGFIGWRRKRKSVTSA